MAENFPQLLIGSHGWLHSQWQSVYYPEDLPEEWQLGYYANDFLLAVIEDKAWSLLKENPQIVTEWLEEAESGLQFICEIEVNCLAKDSDYYLSIIQALADTCIAVVLVGNENQIHDFTMVEKLLAGLPDTIAIYFDVGCIDQILLQQWQKLHALSLCRRVDADSVDVPLKNGDNRQIMLRLQSGSLSLKQLRQLIESACQQAVDQVILIIDGEPPDPELMQNARLIAEML